MMIFPLRLRRFSRDEVVDRSLRHSVKDGLAYSVMTGTAESYFAAFALFLKASNAQIGVLASLPPLLGSFAQLVSAWLGHRGRKRMSLIVFGVSLQALMLLPMLMAPLLFPDHAVVILVGCAVLYFIAQNLAAPQWWSLMGDLVPETRRGRFFAMRSRLCTLVAFIAFVIAGILLQLFDEFRLTVWGFALLFVIASVARFISVHQLIQMLDPPGRVAVLESPFQRRLLQRIWGSPAARFSIFYALLQFAVSIASPFFVVYMLRELQLSYLEYTVVMATVILSQFLTLPRWGRVGDVFGNRAVLLFCGVIIPVLPLLWLFSTQLWYLIAIQVLGGFAWAGFGLSAGNFIYELVPSEKRTTYLALHNVLIGAAVFCGALLGGYLGGHLPTHLDIGPWQLHWRSSLYGVFVLSALARLAIAVSFLRHIHEPRTVRPLSWQAMMGRVIALRSRRRRLAVSLSRMRKMADSRSPGPG